MKVAILTSPDQWFVPYAQMLHSHAKGSRLFYDHSALHDTFDVVFILSYHRIIPESFLQCHKHNIVVHASALPEGKGWAPLFWQVLEGKNTIPFSLFEATPEADGGDIYLQSSLELNGYELNGEIRRKQALHTIDMCLSYLNSHEHLSKHAQSGEASFYPKRTRSDSRLDPDKTLREQFNLLRIVDNNAYPAYFEIDGHRFILKIEEDTHENQ